MIQLIENSLAITFQLGIRESLLAIPLEVWITKGGRRCRYRVSAVVELVLELVRWSVKERVVRVT